MAPEAEARGCEAPGSRSRSRSRCLRKQKQRPQTVNDPQGNDDLLISKVEQELLGMSFLAKGPPIVPSTVTFTGGGRQPALGTNLPHAPFVSEGLDSYVLVVSPTGLDFLVPFMKTTTTQNFKHLVADIVAIDVDGFGLSFDCDMLAEDDLTMGDYGVENGATLGLETEEPEMTRQQCLRVGAG